MYLTERESMSRESGRRREKQTPLGAGSPMRCRTRSQDPVLMTRAEGRHLTN